MSAQRIGTAPGPGASQRADHAACAEAGRGPSEVQLVVVTKTFPASDIRLLAELGVSDVAENRQQEAGREAAELRRPGAAMALRRSDAEQQGRRRSPSYADVVHSIDRPSSSAALARRGAARSTSWSR